MLTGKIGDSSIVMLLYADDTSCSGTYFYSSALHDIEFQGKKCDSGYCFPILNPTSQGNGLDTIAAIFLKPAQGLLWAGRYKPANQSASKVALKQLPLADKHCDSAYSAYRKEFFKIIERETVTKDKITYTYCDIENTPVRYLKIIKGLAPAAAKRINKTLAGMGLEYAELFYSCTSCYSLTDYGFELSNVYVTDRIVSVGLSGSYYCGNASIEDWDAGYNFSAASGKQLRLEDVLYFAGTSPASHAEQDDQFPSDGYAEKLVALLTRLYPQKMVQQKEVRKCDYADPSAWQYGAWYCTPSGIFIKPRYRHFDMECAEENWSVIPYAVARKYKNPSAKIILPQENK